MRSGHGGTPRRFGPGRGFPEVVPARAGDGDDLDRGARVRDDPDSAECRARDDAIEALDLERRFPWLGAGAFLDAWRLN